MKRAFGHLKLFLAVIFTLFGFETSASAHPHIWVDYDLNTVGGIGGITKVKFRWHFDDMFTSMVKENFHVQTMDATHVELLRKSAFSNLKNYHYYTYMTLDGQKFEPQEVVDFGATLKDRSLEYTFTVVLPHPVKKLEVSLYDPEFYVDIGPPLQPISAEKPGIMASAMMKPKDFLSTSAETGAKPPACTWQQGQPRMSSTWGKFALFTITCDAQ